MIDLEEKQCKEVQKILKKLAPGIRVQVYGSRVQGKTKRFSDLDLALEGEKIIPWH